MVEAWGCCLAWLLVGRGSTRQDARAGLCVCRKASAVLVCVLTVCVCVCVCVCVFVCYVQFLSIRDKSHMRVAALLLLASSSTCLAI